MGIPSLWKTVAPAGKSQSLFAYSTELKSQLRAAGSDRTLYIGVDMGPLMAECTAAAAKTSLSGRWAGDEIYILFLRLCDYQKCPVTFLFVLDGDGRPDIKRGHEVVRRDPRWTRLAKELIRLFGYHFHQAPGEAEAELAMLSRLGHIDAILSSDSDTFVFGAETVLKTLPKSKRRFDDEVILFTPQSRENIGLDHHELILYALLCGGDYDSGVTGCSAASAYALAQCGFGGQLIHAMETLTFEQLPHFLANWRAAIRSELSTNSRGKLRQTQPHIASQIPDTFPSLAILRLYLNPLTSLSASDPPVLPDPALWTPREPNLQGLATFCSTRFDWTEEVDLKEKFASRGVWEGAVFQAIYSKYALYDDSRRIIVTPNTSVSIVSIQYKLRTGRFEKIFGLTPQPRLIVSASTLVKSMSPDFQPDSDAMVALWATEALLPPGLRRLGLGLTRNNYVNESSGPSAHAPALGYIDLTASDEEDEATAGPSTQPQPLEIIDLTGSDDEAMVIDLVSD